MSYYFLKTFISALLIVLISETAKRFSLIGAIMASVPLTSVLAMIWLYNETKDSEKIASLASEIFWLVIPSLSFFITLPFFLKNKYGFYTSLFLSLALMILCYFCQLFLLKKLGVKF